MSDGRPKNTITTDYPGEGWRYDSLLQGKCILINIGNFSEALVKSLSKLKQFLSRSEIEYQILGQV